MSEWVVVPLGDGGIVRTADGKQFARAVSTNAVNMSMAHARLIAAAPDLLTACKDTLDYWDSTGFSDCDEDCHCIVEQMRAAIAKAEGQSA